MAHEFTGMKLRLQTADLEGTVSFYRDVLGLEVVEQWSDGDDAGAIFGLEGVADAALLEFGEVESPDNGAASVQLRVEDVADVLARLGDAWPIDGPHERPWGSTYAYVMDPNGVQVVVYAGTKADVGGSRRIIHLLTFEGCPHAAAARAAVSAAIAAFDAPIERVEVDLDDPGITPAFRAFPSPTILVGMKDVSPVGGPMQGRGCRAAGAPAAEDVARAIRAAWGVRGDGGEG
jgi:catechol 2,3-dioxygenase-like lactoylglutathione lyase family enzyme